MPETRESPLSASIQNYLKAIYNQTRNGEPTSTVVLAEALQCRPASITNMLQKLDKSHPELVNYVKHYGVSLTEKGEKAALTIVRRHRLLELFLYQVLGYPLEKVHEEAEELEHTVSPFFIEQLENILEEPRYDPHGEPIPDRDLNIIDTRMLVPLSEITTGESGLVRQITYPDSDLLHYFNTIGIDPGKKIEVMHVNPIDGTRQIIIESNEQSQSLGKKIAEKIMLEII